MEIKIYLRILLDKWWLIALCFLITWTATVVFTFSQAPVYEATATFIVTPSSAFSDLRSFLSGLDVLSGRSEIANTYSEVIKSRLIKSMVLEELGLTENQIKEYEIESNLRAGTNVLQIKVRGTNPTLVRDMTNVIGNKTVSFVSNLYEAYELKPLDSAKLPTTPIKPNKKLYLALGAVFGLVLGIGLAFVAQYLQTPLETVANSGVIDQDSGAYNKRYFMQRLDEEIKRANRQGYPLAVALMNIEQLDAIHSFPTQVQREFLHQVTALLKQSLRDQDIVARFDDTIFAFLLTDTNGAGACETMTRLQTRIAWTPLEVEKVGLKLNLNGVTGVSDHAHRDGRGIDLIERARQAMEKAQSAGYGQVYLIPDDQEMV